MLLANFRNKTKHVLHIRNLKQALNYILVLEEGRRVITCNQKARIKQNIDMSTHLRKKEKRFWKRFFKFNE